MPLLRVRAGIMEGRKTLPASLPDARWPEARKIAGNQKRTGLKGAERGTHEQFATHPE